MGDSFVKRLLRALKLDPTLYREIVAADNSTYQAVLIVVLTSAASGTLHGAPGHSHFIGRHEPALVQMDAPMAELGVLAVLSALAQMVAWPVWAAGICAIGQRLAPSGQALGFWPVARVLAFAQTPVAFVIVMPIMTGAFWLGRVDPDGGGEAPLGLLASSVWSVVTVWVLIGTFLATREVLGTKQRPHPGHLVRRRRRRRRRRGAARGRSNVGFSRREARHGNRILAWGSLRL